MGDWAPVTLTTLSHLISGPYGELTYRLCSQLWLILCLHSLTHSLTSRPSSMTVGDCRWPLNCLSSPLFPVLWHLLQLNVATATPLFYVVHPLSLGLPWWRKPSILPSKTVSAKFPALPLETCPKYCSFIRANFPINSLYITTRNASSRLHSRCGGAYPLHASPLLTLGNANPPPSHAPLPPLRPCPSKEEFNVDSKTQSSA